MSTSFNANQYEDAFVSHRLQNWEVPMKHKNATWFNNHYQSGRPKAQEGFTQVIATDRGHIEEGIPRSAKNPWGDFVGTWDLPKQIPGNCAVVATARRPEAQGQLTKHMDQSNVVIAGQQKNTTRQNKGQLPPVDVPAGAPVSNMLQAEKQVSPAAGSERRSGAEAPIPASTSPAAACACPAKTPSPAPVAEGCAC